MTNNSNNMKFSVVDTGSKTIVPVYTEEIIRNKEYVYYGKDNLWPQYLYGLYDKCATLKSIINGSVDYIVGDSITCTVEKFKEYVNKNDETIEDIIEQISLDYMIYNGFAIQVIYNALNEINEIYALDFKKCRSNEDNSIIYYSKEWGKYSGKTFKYAKFDPTNIDESKTQIFYYKGNSRNVYPLCSYSGAIGDIQTEISCTNYNLNTITNGFLARYIIKFPDGANITDEQKADIEEGIKNKFCGTENSGSFMVYWSSETDDGFKIEKIDSDDVNEMYISIKNSARENIFVAFRCTPNLFGLPSETTGFSSQEYQSAFKLYNKTIVQPIQSKIVRVFDKIFNQVNSIIIEPFKIDFEN